jgi:two-component system OmpR family sensor kinase/two-component system sensor histidine kinase BaeS
MIRRAMRGGRCAPPWWPSNEPWPPRGAGHVWQRRRAHFARRMAIAFAVFMTMLVTGGVTIVSWLLHAVNGGPLGVQPGAVAVVAVVGALVVMVTGVMRRIGLPFTDVVTAAGQVADGDYAVRVAEHGPSSLRSVARAFNSMTAQLQSQDEQRRNLMADIAHELRTPLTVMQGQLEGLLDGVYARDDDRLNEVLEQARLLSRLVEDLRTLAQAERGTLALAKEPIDLGAVIDDAVSAFAAEAAAKRVAISVAPPGETPVVDADPIRIREVLINLVSNALRHSEAGGAITIGMDVGRDAVAVSVGDAGEGIPADALPKIFDRFYKGPSSSGSGLGLTIARNFVRAHGGEISAKSHAGEGTTITFTLPRPASR